MFQKNCPYKNKRFLEGKWGKLFNKSNIPIDVIISPEFEALNHCTGG